MLIVLAWTATIIALFYGEENWRGRRAWNKYRQELEARGEQLDYKTFIPKPIPDEQNFAATPFIESWFSQRTNAGKRWADDFDRARWRVASPKSNDHKGDRRLIDLVAWQMVFDAIGSGKFKPGQTFASNQFDPESRGQAAPAVLRGLKTSDANLEQLRAASRRPSSRYPVVYDLENPWGILIPQLANLKDAVARLQLKACAELAAGQSDKALDDVKLMLYLADSMKEEPILMSYAVRLACFQVAVQPMWEGLAEHRWSDGQLQDLERRLQQYHFLADLKPPLAAERATGILTADLLYGQKYRLSTLDGGDDAGSRLTLSDWMGRIAPHGWYYQEQLNYCRLYQNQLGGTFDPAQKRVFPNQIEDHAHQLEKEIAGGRLGKTLSAIIHHRVLGSLLLPSLGKLPLRAATAQTAADQAALACALERCRLANGQFPEKLEELAPRFILQLPNDVLTGEPYKYRRNQAGGFVLYSIGWDGKDDGGVPGRVLFDEEQGDWVWQYPVNKQ